MEEGTNEIKYAVELGQTLGDVRTVPDPVKGEHPFIVVTHESKVVSLENYLPAPLRIEDKPGFLDTESLIKYTNTFKSERTVVFCKCVFPSDFNIKVYFDYHKPTTPSWCKHSAEYKLALSNEWQLWVGQNNKPFSQFEFAEFIENNILDIVSPPGADLLEIASSLDAKKKIDFKSAVRLSDGTNELYFNDTTQTKVAVPAKILLGVAPFMNGAKYEVSARLRYRVRENKLEFIYLLDRPEKIVEAAFKATMEKIGTETGLALFLGSR